MHKIRKAVIPAAGFGTRFLPATKSMPKEMLPIIDKPAIHYAVEEAVKSGIDEIIFITGRGKNAIEDYFDHSYELEHTLELKGKDAILEEVRAISDMANIVYIRQKEPLGLGHAVLRAKDLVGNEPFAVILPDDFLHGEKPCIGQMVKVFEKTGKSVILTEEVPEEKVSSYGVVDPQNGTGGEYFELKGIIEKPDVSEAPSNHAVVGRYVLKPEIFDYLEETKPGKGGEIQLTDAIIELIKNDGMVSYKMQNEHYDTGDKLGFLKATVHMGLKHEKLGSDLREYLKNIV
jgi:UTP--glucose-1-phosphate uridylyltransferase